MFKNLKGRVETTTKKKKTSVLTGRSGVPGAMAGKEGQEGAGPPYPQSAIPQAPGLQWLLPHGELKYQG